MLVAIKPAVREASIMGGVLAMPFFVSTVSFLFTAPGVSESMGLGVPSLSALGELLFKHVLLLGLSFWTITDSIRAGSRGHGGMMKSTYSRGEFGGRAQ